MLAKIATQRGLRHFRYFGGPEVQGYVLCVLKEPQEVAWLERLLKASPRLRVVVSSREDGFPSNQFAALGFRTVRVDPLSPSLIAEVIRRRLGEDTPEAKWVQEQCERQEYPTRSLRRFNYQTAISLKKSGHSMRFESRQAGGGVRNFRS